MKLRNTLALSQQQARRLTDALVVIDNAQTMENFLSDLMTEKEITELSARLQAASMLSEGKKYAEITKTTKLSSRTIARISDWLKNGSEGYRIAIDSTSLHHAHISPASAE